MLAALTVQVAVRHSGVRRHLAVSNVYQFAELIFKNRDATIQMVQLVIYRVLLFLRTGEALHAL